MAERIADYIERYPHDTNAEIRNALKQVIQEITLSALAETDFFSKAAFYGGTALRIFYGLDRFSEDMDFSLKQPDPGFDFSVYFPIVSEKLSACGFELEIGMKRKTADTAMQSAFLKGNTQIHIAKVRAENPPFTGVPYNELLKIKLEIDTNPPGGACFETRSGFFPKPYEAVLYDGSCLFSGKIHAILCRRWGTKVKGRDYYDFLWYLDNGIPVNLEHLEKRMIQSGDWEENRELTHENLLNLLRTKFSETDFRAAVKDVEPFVRDRTKLSVWNSPMFISLLDSLDFVSV